MTSLPRPFAIALAFLGFASISPATAGAPCPTYLTRWGSLGTGDGQFNRPNGVATNAAGDVFVADQENDRIQKFTSTGAFIEMWGWGVATGAAAYERCTSGCQAGIRGSGDGQFDRPRGVATNAAGDVYVVDCFNDRIQKFTGTGTYLLKWGSLGSGDGQFDEPLTVATDATGDVYIGDYYQHRIQKFTGTGTYLLKWGSLGSGDGQFNGPYGVATDPAGNVYVADEYNHRVQKFTGSGTYLLQWGSLGTGDGQFNEVISIATDAAGDVYVDDRYNSRIEKFTGTGTYLCQFPAPASCPGIATDDGGNVYLSHHDEHHIQKFGPGAISTQATSWGRIKSIYR